jgi:hypothetical protein
MGINAADELCAALDLLGRVNLTWATRAWAVA